MNHLTELKFQKIADDLTPLHKQTHDSQTVYRFFGQLKVNGTEHKIFVSLQFA